MEGAAKFFGPLITFGLIGYGIYYWISNNTGTFLIIIYAIIVVVIVLFCLAMWRDHSVSARVWKGMPEDGPMKVNLEIEQRGPSRHRLHIDVKMTQKDWNALHAGGLHNNLMFEYGDGEHYVIGKISRVKYVDFDSLGEAEAAKEELISNLHIIRNHIDHQRDLAARPADRHESLEI
jgi:hypothetical protein